VLPPGRNEKYDVVVIGSGMAGTAASLQARLDGASVVTLDKMAENRSGGNTRVSGGIFAVPSADTAEAKANYLDDFIKKSDGRGNIEIYKVLAERGNEGVNWMKEHGAQFQPTAPFPPYRLSIAVASPGIFVGMPNVLGTLRRKYVELGGKVAYDTKAKQLIMDARGRVVGVRAVGPDGVVDYMSNAVIIAAGGYAGNKHILQQFIGPDAGGMMVRGRTWATGDGLTMAQEAGAGLLNLAGIASLHVAAVNKNEPASGNPFSTVPYALGINRDGKRYIDESLGYVAHGKAVLAQPQQTVALVFDEEIKKVPAVASSVGLFERLKQPAIEANSLEELAGKIGVPAAALVETVKAFNDQVKDGKALSASPRKAALAFKVEKPKFYAFYPLVPGITLSFGGIMIDTGARVLEPDGRAIPGLYAAGEGAGGLYYDDYIAGGSLANCLVMGRIAGASAAKLKG
jgi:flavocytochrome c